MVFFFPLILFQDPITTMEILERSASACGLKYKRAYQKKKKMCAWKGGKTHCPFDLVKTKFCLAIELSYLLFMKMKL